MIRFGPNNLRIPRFEKPVYVVAGGLTDYRKNYREKNTCARQREIQPFPDFPESAIDSSLGEGYLGLIMGRRSWVGLLETGALHGPVNPRRLRQERYCPPVSAHGYLGGDRARHSISSWGGVAYGQCAPDPNDPVPLEVWDPQCYVTCSDSDCSNNPSDPNACCDPNCTLCLGAKGCLPLARAISWFDADSDGWPDAFTIYRDPVSATDYRRLYWNGGLSSPLWTEGCLLPSVAGVGGTRHCTLGDVNNDGYADFGHETSLLYNRGQRLRCSAAGGCGSGGSQCDDCDYANFIDKTDCLDMGGVTGTVETHCFGDVDGDCDIDFFICSESARKLFVNTFSYDPNECPDPNCSPDPNAYTMDDWTANCGIPGDGSGGAIPEAAQFSDYDRDGDLDLFNGNRIWQNITETADEPSFRLLDTSGISGSIDEGAVFIDIDMDGDMDMVRVSQSSAATANAAFGDGVFATAKELPDVTGAFWCLSAADWDNDGDADLTVGRYFLLNRLLEEAAFGSACDYGPDCEHCCFEKVTFSGDPNTANALVAWADVDRDGDLDCAQAKLDHGSTTRQKFLKNHQVDSCDEADRRYVNLRPVRAAPANGPEGKQRDYTENEFGAQVELVVRNNPDGNTNYFRRVQFTASSSGYLNQNEYPVHVGLPADPDPNDPDEDVRFDLYVDFPVLVDEPYSSPVRIDWTVNSQLADINLADLYVTDPNDPETRGRPITVYRDGRVRFKGADPNTVDDPNAATMYLLGGPLRLPAPGVSLPGLTSGDKIAGYRFTKGQPPDPNNDPPSGEVRIREFIIDGQLDEPDPNGCPYNIVVLDVTDPNNPVTIGGLVARTFPNNRRTFIPVPPDPNDPNAFVLPHDPNNTRSYDVRVRLTSYRSNTLSDLSALNSILGITLSGGLNLINSSGTDICTQTMSLQFGGSSYTSPVKVRLSRKSN